MIQFSKQDGVGLIEVLVAVLLLSVAVLGFSALQMRAISATDESLVRTQALSVIRGLAENMRANSQQINTYQTTINDASKTRESCTQCTADQIAVNESKDAFDKLYSYGINVKMMTCPGTANFSQVKCVIAAWADTKPLMDSSADACANENGIYNSGSKCIIVETY